MMTRQLGNDQKKKEEKKKKEGRKEGGRERRKEGREGRIYQVGIMSVVLSP